MNLKRKSGQILVLVLLVVVVVLAVGLSVASRNLTNLRTSTQAEQSQRAFTAAEGGVEDALSKLNAVANVIESGTPNAGCVRDTTATDTANCTLTTTDTSVVPAGSTIKVKATKGYEKTVEPGDVAQINLQGGGSGSWTGDLKIDWIKTGQDPAEVTLEVIFVCQGSSGTCMGDTMVNGFGQHRRAYSNPGGVPSGQVGTGFTNCGSGGTGFSCGATLNVTSSNVKIIRIKPFWNRTTMKVSPLAPNDATFPVQTYEITSTATTETGVSRKVEVRRDALPQLPGIFDYVLYSGGDIIK